MDELAVVRRSRPLAEIRSELQHVRETTKIAISTLKREVVVRTDWHTYVNARPWLFVGAAFCAGFVLASLSSRSR